MKKQYMKILAIVLIALMIVPYGTSFATTSRLGASLVQNYNPTKTLSKTSDYTVLTTDFSALINVDATSAAVNITLPSAATLSVLNYSFPLKVVKTDSSTNVVTVTPATGDTIGGESARKIVNQNGIIMIHFGPRKDWTVDYESPYVVEDHEAGSSDLGTQGYDASIIFEGSTANDYETTVSVVDPTADATWSIPAATAGTFYFMSTALSTNYVDAANAVTGVSNGIKFEGATADDYETTVSPADPTADRTITLPNDTGAIMLTSVTTQTIGGVNAVWGVSAGIAMEGATSDASELTITSADPSADRTATFPDSTGTVMLSSLATNSADAANAVTGTSNGLLFEGATADDYETTLTPTDATADRTITMPDATGTVNLTTGTGSATGGVYTAQSTSVTLTSADCGKLITATTGTLTITLPATVVNCEITVVNGVGVSAMTIDPNIADNIYGGCTLAGSVVTIDDTAGDSVTNTTATAVKGDFMRLAGDGNVGWYITGCQGIWAED